MIGVLEQAVGVRAQPDASVRFLPISIQRLGERQLTANVHEEGMRF